MCGLFAWWPQNPAESDASQVRDALLSLSQRGPDSEGLWVNAEKGAYIGHRRLKITGENGAQPLWNARKTHVAIVNGELYDVEQRRQQFAAQGYVFQTDSDSELVLAVYELHGVSGISMLEGEFAFVLWDIELDRVWAARDRAGIKPLRFILDERGLAFASEAKAFFACGWKAQWDSKRLAQALTIQYPDPCHTLFKGVEQLAPGECGVFSRKEGVWTIERWQWWSWFPHTTDALRAPSDTQAFEELDIALRRAVGRRVQTSWPIAVHLSGGMDSSAILACANSLKQHDLHAFSVGFEAMDGGAEVEHDECVFAEQTALSLGVPWTRVDAHRNTLLEHWKEAVYRAEGLGINGHLVAKWLLARHIHKAGFRVSLSGEGSDEALLGYAFLMAEHDPTNQAAQEKLQSENPVAKGVMLPDGAGVDLSCVEREWGWVPVWLRAKASLGSRVQSLMRPEWRDDECPRALDEWAVMTRPEVSEPGVHQASATWARLALGGYILPTLADAQEAAWHIQGRVPFLDRDLLETVMQWAPETTGWPHTPKQPLRTWLEKNGLPDVAQRPKHPFEAPPLWGSEHVRHVVREQWCHPKAWDHTPFQPELVTSCMDYLDQASAIERQLWEPVIATLLSVYHLRNEFNLTLPVKG